MRTRFCTAFVPAAAILLLVSGCGGKNPPPAYDVPPVLANREEITAAMSAVGAGLEARVVLQVRVDEKGYVREARIAQTSGNQDLDAAAEWIGEQMRFEPARYKGEAVAAWVEVPVSFDVVSRVVHPPRLMNAAEVVAIIARDYPDLRGTARFRVQVGPEGWARQVKEQAPFDREVMSAGRQLIDDYLKLWPAQREGRPVNEWIILAIEFAAEGSKVYIEESGT